MSQYHFKIVRSHWIIFFLLLVKTAASHVFDYIVVRSLVKMENSHMIVIKNIFFLDQFLNKSWIQVIYTIYFKQEFNNINSEL